MTSHSEAQHLIKWPFTARLSMPMLAKSRLPKTLLEQLKERRDEVLAVLTVPRLPWRLERLVNAASSGVFTIHLTGVPNTTHYVMAWACAYLAGDKDEALRRLWEVHNIWQAAN
jgi:hypothetical protein